MNDEMKNEIEAMINHHINKLREEMNENMSFFIEQEGKVTKVPVGHAFATMLESLRQLTEAVAHLKTQQPNIGGPSSEPGKIIV